MAQVLTKYLKFDGTTSTGNKIRFISKDGTETIIGKLNFQ